MICGAFARIAALSLVCAGAWATAPRIHDVVIRHATIYDGLGGQPYAGELAIDGERIAYVGGGSAGRGRLEIDARGQAVAPGFIDMMGHSEESLLIDGRAVMSSSTAGSRSRTASQPGHTPGARCAAVPIGARAAAAAHRPATGPGSISRRGRRVRSC